MVKNTHFFVQKRVVFSIKRLFRFRTPTTISKTQAERFPFWFYKKLLQKIWVMSLGDFQMENPLGLPSLPHLRRQISSRIGDFSGKTSSLYLRQVRQSLCLEKEKFQIAVDPRFNS